MLRDCTMTRPVPMTRVTSPSPLKRLEKTPPASCNFSFMDTLSPVPILVAGIHFEEDLVGPGESWKSAFEARGVAVAMEKEGLGGLPGIIDIFGESLSNLGSG